MGGVLQGPPPRRYAPAPEPHTRTLRAGSTGARARLWRFLPMFRVGTRGLWPFLRVRRLTGFAWSLFHCSTCAAPPLRLQRHQSPWQARGYIALRLGQGAGLSVRDAAGALNIAGRASGALWAVVIIGGELRGMRAAAAFDPVEQFLPPIPN